MKFLGIDYGSKRIGLASSDEGGQIAFPREVLLNDNKTISKIREICKKEKIGKIVLGESLTLSGEPNPVMEEILNFKKKLEKETGIEIILEKEFSTSALARRGPIAKKPIATERRISKKEEFFDDKAAALILQRYLDKNKNESN